LEACSHQNLMMAEIFTADTPIPISSVLVLMAMRDCTDALSTRLSHTLCIEIGGAMTADTPPEQITEAA
jgi:hypothetical protein